MKNQLLTIALIFIAVFAMGQAKKPTIMVVPSDVWCTQNNYMMKYDNQGTEVRIPDYKLALQSDVNLLLVISKINTMMADRGFPLKNLETVLKDIEQSRAEDNMTSSKTSGASIAESPLDILKRTAKADIIMQLTYTVNTQGPKKYITFILQGLDSYTDKQIAGAQGSGTPSFSADLPILLEEAVLSHIDNFNAQLQQHFDDLLTNGREVTVRIRVWDSSPVNLENEYDGKELAEIIDDWMAAHTVNHRYSNSDGTENFILFEQVRIPLYAETGKAMDTRQFVTELKKYLNAAPFSITCKVMVQGLGRATLVIGEK
ncbi:MAG: hypothetical protein IPH88_04205 [Bacteroidales bacterium]|nr:hypothetical protein [Bacteroidales bacterium]